MIEVLAILTMNYNFTLRLNEDGEYAMMIDAATRGQSILEKLEDNSSDLEEKKEIKYVMGTRPKKFTIISPAIRHLPYPASAWPTITKYLDDEFAADGTKVYVYTLLRGRETTLSFTSKAQREVVHRIMQSEMARRKANGEKKCLSVKALLNRFLASDH